MDLITWQNAGELSALLLVVVGIWRGRGSLVRKSLETARELDQAAREMQLDKKREAFDEVISELDQAADDVPEWAEELRAKIDKAWPPGA